MTEKSAVWCVLTCYPADDHLVSIHATSASAGDAAAANDGWYVRRWVVQEEADTASHEEEVSFGPVRRHPEVCNGELTFVETRVWVDSLFGYLRGGHSIAEWREDFPSVPLEHAQQTLDLALQLLEEATSWPGAPFTAPPPPKGGQNPRSSSVGPSVLRERQG